MPGFTVRNIPPETLKKFADISAMSKLTGDQETSMNAHFLKAFDAYAMRAVEKYKNKLLKEVENENL